MNKLYFMAPSVGFVAGLWTWISMYFGLITFAGFLACATFYAAGGGLNAFRSAIFSNYSGVLWGYVMILFLGFLTNVFDSNVSIAISVGVLTVVMILQAKVKYLAYTPGVFIGTATFFASNNEVAGCLISLLGGALFGIISETLGVQLHKRLSMRENQ